MDRIWFRTTLVAAGVLFAHIAPADDSLRLSWTNNLLTISSPQLPAGKLDVWYLEAFCRKGSTHRDWGKTVLPHKTRLVSAGPTLLSFHTDVQPDVIVTHTVTASEDEVEFKFNFENRGKSAVDLEWFQPACIRVADFTGLDQTNYTRRSFIFTARGLTTLEQTRRTEEAVYHGGQVYVPAPINLEDVNPRPICLDQPVNGLIGCFSKDNRQLLATASGRTQELFEGVYVCLHSDPRVGGLEPGRNKQIRAKLYLMKNDPSLLLKRYERDFPFAEPFKAK